MSSWLDPQIPCESDPATGLPVGPRLARADAAPRPGRIVLEGRFARLEPLDARVHVADLYRTATVPDAAARFQYLADDPPADRGAFEAWLQRSVASPDPLFFAVIDRSSGRAEGWQTLMRIDPANRSIEIGNIYWGPVIARTPVTTEANFLFARYAFEALGYRRYEWKCNALNAPSRRAAERFGFTFEGHFRRSNIVKGRTRDTTWYSIIEEEWPAIREAHEAWLAPSNFDAAGRQRSKLAALIEDARDRHTTSRSG
jgi:RimJ/RimL family protein N-acetyltransferase